MLYIHLFGHVQVLQGESRREVKLLPSARVLLAYLLIQPNRVYPREVLADIAWGDRPESQARSCLNTALWRLRRALDSTGALGESYLISAPAAGVGFNWESHHWLDVAAFERCATRILALPANDMQPEDARQLERVLPLYVGDLLEGFYDDWALRERERLRGLYLNCLVRMLRFHKNAGSFDQALAYGRHILGDDPLREEIHREMMRLYFANGARGLAVRQYEACREALAAELGIEPMPETQALYRQIAAHHEAVEPRPEAAPHLPAVSQRTTIDLGQALQQLRAAAQNLESAREELRLAMDLVDRLHQSSA
jgi:DNA-binding SARP family transcriptional activator